MCFSFSGGQGSCGRKNVSLMLTPQWFQSRRTNGAGRNRRAKFEPLEPRLALTALLRPGEVPDALTLSPADAANELVLVSSPIDGNLPSGLQVIDLSQITADDQRYFVETSGAPWFRVDTSEAYRLTASPSPQMDEGEIRLLPLHSFDIDRKPIEAIHVTRHGAAVDTTLAADLSPGDWFLLVADASGWSNQPWESATTRALAWYGYTNSQGQTYDDYTYTRNLATGEGDGLWAAGSIWYDASVGAYRVPLLEPWSGPALAAGAAVRNAAAGIDFTQPIAELSSDADVRWPQLSATIAGEWIDGERDEHKFLPGTAYVQPYSVSPTVWDDATFGPAADFSSGVSETVVATASRQFTLELDVLSKQVFDPNGVIPGDFNGDFRVDAADYNLWRDGMVADENLYALWRANYGTSGSGSYVLESVSAEFGAASVVGDAIEYESPEWFVGTDVVQYTVRDTVTGELFESQVALTAAGSNFEQDAVVAATIESQGQVGPGSLAPRLLGGDHGYSVATGETLSAVGLLDGFVDPGNVLVVRLAAGAAHGAVSLGFDGSFSYTPSEGFAGVDTFRYEVFDGFNSVTAVASIEVLSEAQLLDSRLREVALSMLNHESGLGRFPVDDNPDYFDATGQPYVSWRVHALYYSDHRPLYEQFKLDEPWNSPHNLPLLDQMPDVYRHPGDAADSTTTRLQTFTGNGAAFGSRPAGEDQRGLAIRQLRDGDLHTILFAESAADAAVPWTQPVDLQFDPNDPLAALGNYEGDRFTVVVANSGRLTLPVTVDPATFASLVTFDGGEVIDALSLRRQFANLNGGEEALLYGLNREDVYMRGLALGALNYADVFGRFPVNYNPHFDDDGNPFVSWRVHILPYLGYINLYERFNLEEPWDSENNLPLLAEMPDFFRSAGDTFDTTTTRIQTFTGLDAPFGFYKAGLNQRGPTPAQIFDGFENTILYVEAAADHAVPWTQPVDLAFDVNDPLAGLDLSADSIRTAFFDTSTRRLNTRIAEEAFAGLVTRAGGEVVDPSRYPASEGNFKLPIDVVNDFKQIAIAMLNYESSRNRLPADTFDDEGSPLLSWRVAILPYIEQQALYNQFRRDEPWDSPHNLSLLELMPDVFRGIGDPADSTTTQVQTFVGPNAPFPAEGQLDLDGIQLREITDGTHNTIAFVEAGGENATPWTKPGGLPLYVHSPFSPLGELGGEFVAGFFDGHIETLSTGITPGTLRALVTPRGDDDPDNPFELPLAPSITIIQTGGDTVTNEFGVDFVYVVLDAPPTADVVVDVSSANVAVAKVDRPQLTFTPNNWDTPQRVAVRGADNFVTSADQVISVAVAVNDSQSAVEYRDLFTFALFVTITDDEPVPPTLAGDYNGDGALTLVDYTRWRDNLGTANLEPYTSMDASGDGEVTELDYTAWRSGFGVAASSAAASYFSPLAESSVTRFTPSLATSASPASYDLALLLLLETAEEEPAEAEVEDWLREEHEGGDEVGEGRGVLSRFTP